MRRILITLLFLLFSPVTAAGEAWLLEIDGAVGPANADYLVRGLADAGEAGAALVVLRIDTPGGLDSSMRTMVQAIIGSPVPVAAYVAPSGGRAASAGAYLVYAAHVAAMAPATNVGAATPVKLGGLPLPEGAEQKGMDAMEKKIVNDATAYIRSLAELRGRNAEWAEKAVRDGASLPASEALAEGVIDLVADDVATLLAALDGRRVKTASGEVTLNTQGMTVRRVAPDWRAELLAVIANPNVAYMLLLLGIYGLIFEFAHPGFILPGVVGAISLVLGLYALQLLPVNYTGLALMGLGIAFMIAEAFVPSFGALGLGGVVAFALGSVILIDAEGYSVSLALIASVALVSAAFFIGVVGMAVKARSRPVVSGAEEMVGAEGVVLDDFAGKGRIRVHGEVWAARADGPLARGERVRVTALEGLQLEVRKLGESKEES